MERSSVIQSNAMYEVLDEQFLAAHTWVSGHSLDEARFFRALHRIVGNDDFSSRRLGEYVEKKFLDEYGSSEEEQKRSEATGRSLR